MNNYGTVDVPPNKTFPALHSLHFRSNNISDWQQIAKLGFLFPNLTNIVLLDNPLERFPDIEEMCANFQKLKSINISETAINSWAELEKFRYFPELSELRVQDIPLLKVRFLLNHKYLKLTFFKLKFARFISALLIFLFSYSVCRTLICNFKT